MKEYHPPQDQLKSQVIDVSHISASSPFIVTTRHWRGQTLPRGQAFQIHTRTGRTRLIRTGEFIPETSEDSSHTESEEDRRVSAVSVGAVTASGSEDHYCMLDSGANVMVVPWKEGMEGDHTMCALVGDNKTEGLVVARLATRQRTHLIVGICCGKRSEASHSHILLDQDCTLSGHMADDGGA